MGRTSDKRGRLIEAAKNLLHRKGFQGTTLADIARESGVALGNLYYYFKTKEELCEAVIDERKKEVSRMLNMCCTKPDPKIALSKFVQHIADEADELAKCGCPNMGLCLELDKSPSHLSASAGCIVPLIEWCADQFKALGFANYRDTAVEFNARLQGIIMLGHTLHDPALIRRQLKLVAEWVDALQSTQPSGPQNGKNEPVWSAA